MRAMPDSPRVMTDSKRRLTDPKELLIPNKDPSPIDILLNTSPTDSPPTGKPLVEPRSPIGLLRDDVDIRALAKILENSDELVQKAKQILKCLKDGILKSDEGVQKFSNVMREVWLNRCFINGLRSVEKNSDIVGPVLHFSNQELPTRRLALTEADPLLEPSLTAATTNFNIMRVFLSILIGYWGDKGELKKLDEAMGKDVFGRMAIAADFAREKREKIKKKDRDFFDLQPCKRWLVSKYGNDNVDIEAILGEIRFGLLRFLDFSQQFADYDWKKARICIWLANGCYSGLEEKFINQ